MRPSGTRSVEVLLEWNGIGAHNRLDGWPTADVREEIRGTFEIIGADLCFHLRRVDDQEDGHSLGPSDPDV